MHKINIKAGEAMPEDPAREIQSVIAGDTDNSGNLKDAAAQLVVQEVEVSGVKEYRHWKSVEKA